MWRVLKFHLLKSEVLNLEAFCFTFRVPAGACITVLGHCWEHQSQEGEEKSVFSSRKWILGKQEEKTCLLITLLSFSKALA